MMSLPIWECGLKQSYQALSESQNKSLPIWECGLKRDNTTDLMSIMGVTPHMGVWIETHQLCLVRNAALVTPHMGVWIETQK